MKHIFIVNPTAGKSKPDEIITMINTICTTHKVEYEIIQTKYRKHATMIASSFTTKDDVTLYCVGGDGTLSEVLNGIDPKVPMAVIPCGSGNDFYKMFEETPSPIKTIIENTLFGSNAQIDCGMANQKRFINCFSTGLDADVAEHAHQMLREKKATKNMAYIKSALLHALKPKKLELVITLDEEIVEQNCLLVAVMNGRYYGGGFQPVENPSLQDGLLDVCVIDFIKSSKIFPLLAKFYQGKHTKLDICKIRQAKKITIESKDMLLMQCDGEAFYTNKVELSCMKHQQTLRIPSHINYN
ncbi:MAG: YegS/Rv2252/BmrU family lipid kinase [Erysipelotrichaceae bacterium]